MTAFEPESGLAPRHRQHRWLARLGLVVLCVFTVLAAIWSALAIFYQLGGAERVVGWSAVVLVSLAILALAIKGRRWLAAGVLALGLLAVSLWWASILPSNERDWASDVAHGVTAEFAGREVIVHNVRNFAWRTEDEGEVRWETRRFDLDSLASVDLISSTWGNPAIAHTLMSFGFRDGQHLVFSAEIRREKGEKFSEIGGFFKEFELVLVAADERDIVLLRTNMRREEVSLFPLKMAPDMREALFLSYLELGNELAATPRFYQTVTTNCTTVIFKLVRLIDPGIPLDWRILVSGYLPDYLYEQGLIVADQPLDVVKEQARIGGRARAAGDVPDFSALIRAPVPAAP